MILAISAVSAADTNDTSDSAIQAVDEAPVEEVASEDVDAVASTENTDVLADVGNNFTSLQSSIDTGTVVMDKDYARVEGESTLSISKDVTIEGNGHKIDGSNLGGIFNVNSGCTLTLNGVTLINGNAENGGAVYNNGGTLVIENSYFINNTATKSGGAIYNNGGTLNVIGSTFDGNDLTDRSVNGYGGAAIYSAAGDVTISTSRITNNLKDIVHRGGTGAYTGDLSSAAVSNKNGALTVTDSIFESNSGSYGGAILSQGTTSSLIVSGSNFNNNFAFNGGAIYCPDGNYHISKSNFTGNKVRGTGSTKTSYAHGGAIAATETASDCIISDCVFKDNSATMGGAISTTDTQVIGCTFINNTAQSAYAESFNGKTNNVGGYGAATYSDKVMIIDGSTFINNTNTRNENVYLRNATVTNSVFVNTIVNVNRGPLTISNNTYDNAGKDIAGGNSPSIYFDGVGDIPYVTNGKVYFDVSSFADLQAMIDSGSTGGIYLTGDITKLDSEYETFANGIYINRSVSIYGEGFTISSNNGKVFNVDSAGSLTINNAEIAGDGTAAITNDGTVSVGLTTNFTNVGDYAIENNGRVSQSSLTTFTQLNNLIALVSGGEVYIGSSKITKADDEKATFADGIVVEKDLTITGFVNYKGEISTYLDADNSGRIFSVNDGATLTLNKMILKNGNAENGGAVYVEANNNLIANTVDFIDNVASEYDGGAIYTVGGTIALTDCVLDGNDVTKLETSASQSRGGAAIYAKDAQLTLVNTNVTNNGRSELDRTKGDLVNAVINLINSNAAITGGLFENNTGIYGGAIFADGEGSQTLTVSGATFKNNKAYNGGAIDISSMITDISDCTFDNNWVVGPGSTGYYALGGAVATDGSGSFSLADCNFTGNRATGLNASAGAVSAGLDQGCPATIDGCVFKENTAELKGGAVLIAGYDDDATISNCNFSDDNTAEIGSSIYNGGNLKLTGNTIEGDASGIYSSGAGKIDTHVWVIVNDNQDVTVEYYDTIPIVVKITDDNGNLIRIDEPTIEIDLGDRWTRYTLTLDESTGFYTMDNYLVDQKSGLLTPSRTTIGKYFSSYNANTNLNSSYVTMIKADASMEVTYQNVSRPDDVVITINLTGKQGAPKISWAATSATPFKVTVNDVEYKVKITNGIGTLTIPDLPAGEYVVNAYWDGNTKYNPIEPTTSILKVSNLNVTKFTVETIGKYLSDDNVTLYVTLLGLNGEGLNETFNVIVNNTEYAVTVTNGTGTLNISGLAPGHYSALGIFPGNNNYNGAYATGLFTVLYPSPILNVTAEDITYGEDVILNINLTEADGTPIDGGIGINVGGKFSLDISIIGFASIHVPNLPANESGWAIEVYYYGDEEHVNTQNLTETVKVAKATSTVDLTGPFDINIGENAEFTANIGAKSDVFVLNIWVDGKEYIAMGPAEWYSNVASFMITPEWLPEARDYNITVQFIGNENYTASENVSQILTVNKIDAGNVIQISGSTVTYGENATVTVELPMDAEGNVTVTIPGVGTFNETVEGGIAVVEIPGLGVGLYELVAVEYSGDNRYASHTGMATVEVKQAKSSVEIKPIAEVTYGNNVTIRYTVLNATTIKINVAYGGLVPVCYVTFDANVSKYDGSLVLSNLAAGEYFVVVENDGNDNYTFSAAPADFIVNKAEPTMQTEISPNIKAGDADVVVQVVLPENATGKVMLLIDGEPTNQMGYDLINGTVNITVPADFVNAGKRSYYVIYDGDDNYTSAYDLKSFDVSKVDPMVVIAVYADLDTTEPEVVSVFVGNVTGGLTVARATGQILIEGYGVARLVDLVDGIYKLELIDIVPGDYEITVTYLGDDNFNNASNSTKFTVPKRAATVEITNVTANILGGQNATFTVNMNPDSTNGNVTIYINGTEYATVVLDDEYANATVSIPGLGKGTHTIGVKYNGNDHYNASEVVNTTVTVEKAGSKVTIDPIDNVTFGHTVEISYTVENETTVTYAVVDESGANQTYEIKDGKLVLSGLSVGNYTVTITNAENDMFTGDSATAKFTVSENPTFDFNVNFPENSTDTVFSISVPEDAGGYLLVDIDGQHYYAPVENGTASISIPGLAPGNYTATVSYTGDGKYDNATITKEVTVPSNLPEDALTIPENGDTDTPTTYSISLPADATGYLIVDVDGTKYVAALENGSASVTVPALSEGQHNVTVTYTGDDKYSSASKSTTLNVKKPVYKITNNKNVKAVYSAKAYYKVLVTKDGKAVGAGEKVTFKYNGKTYTVKTDSKGYATLKLNTKVKVKKYTITAEYKGVKVTNKVTIKHVIKAKNKKVKKSKKVTKVKITLKKVNGKVLKAKKLKVKFRGKKYTVKTNKKGVATWKVKKSMLKKLKVGKKYKYKVTYGKDVVTKKLTIKK